MLRYETHQTQISQIFSLINTGRFYSLTFVKKGDGQLRYLNGHRATYKKPDGTEGVVQNVGYDPKDHNLIRVFDRNALNPKTGEKTGNYRAAALENIIYIKCGGELFDFIEENQIAKRFPYVNLEEVRAKMKIDSAIQEEVQNFVNETGDLLGIVDLAEFLTRVDPNVHQEDMQGMLQQEYQNGGDEAVRKFFYEMSNGTDLQILGRGKYALKF